MQASALNIIWILFQILIGYNLVLPIFVLGIYLIRKRNCKVNITINEEADYAIIVTAYEQTYTIPAVIESILALNYQNFIVYIVADKCDISNLIFADIRVVILRPEETIASNIGSHFYAIQRFKRGHERLTIIDSDNLVEPQYLNELNKVFDQGFVAVQGVRAAKNLDTVYACLDAARDIYYHFYDGKVLFGSGSSATLAGSGMAFTTTLYRACLEHVEISGAGFDKVLQYQILTRNNRIAFAEKAIVYDEKTTMSDQLVKQRSRWINTWFKYFTLGFELILNGIRTFSFNQFLFGFILLRPPLFIFLILSLLCMFINLGVNIYVSAVWLIGFAIFVFGFFLALFSSETNPKIYKSLINIPKFVFFQILSLLKSRKANKHSVATEHFHTEIRKELKDK